MFSTQILCITSRAFFGQEVKAAHPFLKLHLKRKTVQLCFCASVFLFQLQIMTQLTQAYA